VIAFVLLADLLRAATFSDWVKQLDAVAVGHSQDSWISQESISPIAVSFQQSEQSRALWKARKQRQVVTFYPAIESTITNGL
jgi:hypothetical protein